MKQLKNVHTNRKMDKEIPIWNGKYTLQITLYTCKNVAMLLLVAVALRHFHNSKTFYGNR